MTKARTVTAEREDGCDDSDIDTTRRLSPTGRGGASADKSANALPLQRSTHTRGLLSPHPQVRGLSPAQRKQFGCKMAAINDRQWSPDHAETPNDRQWSPDHAETPDRRSPVFGDLRSADVSRSGDLDTSEDRAIVGNRRHWLYDFMLDGAHAQGGVPGEVRNYERLRKVAEEQIREDGYLTPCALLCYNERAER